MDTKQEGKLKRGIKGKEDRTAHLFLKRAPCVAEGHAALYQLAKILRHDGITTVKLEYVLTGRDTHVDRHGNKITSYFKIADCLTK